MRSHLNLKYAKKRVKTDVSSDLSAELPITPSDSTSKREQPTQAPSTIQVKRSRVMGSGAFVEYRTNDNQHRGKLHAEEDTTQGFRPMIENSHGMLGRGFRAGFDGETQAEQMIDRLLVNLHENDRAENADTTQSAIETVFPVAHETHSIEDLLRTLEGRSRDHDECFPMTAESLKRLSTQLNLVPTDLLRSVNDLKRRVGELPQKKYFAIRNALFPECMSGSRNYRNRAGDKLEAVLEESGIAAALRNTSRSTFLFADVCGGPGAFSEMLFEWIPRVVTQTPAVHVIGTGITLQSKANVPGSLAWYSSLLKRPREVVKDVSDTELSGVFLPCWGVDGTGDILSEKNITNFAETCRTIAARINDLADNEAPGRVIDLVVADGGFNVDGKEAFQEVLSGHLLLCETIIALQTLRDGGSYIVKAFDTLTPFTAGLIYILTFCFEKVMICKPHRSRVVNSERYIVGKQFRLHSLGGVLVQRILRGLIEVHRTLHRAKVKNEMPTGALSESFLLDDFGFLSKLREATAYWMRRQKSALEQIVKKASG